MPKVRTYNHVAVMQDRRNGLVLTAFLRKCSLLLLHVLTICFFERPACRGASASSCVVRMHLAITVPCLSPGFCFRLCRTFYVSGRSEVGVHVPREGRPLFRLSHFPINIWRQESRQIIPNLLSICTTWAGVCL